MRNIAHNDIIKDAMAMGKRDNDMPVVFFDIIRDITSKLDSQVAIGLILKAGRDLTKADFCNIALIKNNKMHIYPQVEGMGTYNIDEGIMGYVVATGRPRLVGDVKRDEYYKMCNETTISELAVPIKYNSKCIGVLNVESSKENAFNKSDRDVLMAMADFAASAINNARHHEELKILREIDQKITSSLDLIETLSLIRDKASELINTNDIRIRLLEGSKLIPVVGVEQSQISAATWEIGECIAGKAAEDREPKLEKDVQNNPYFKKALSKIQDKKRKDDLLKINSEIAVPLLIKSEVIGVLNAHSPRKSAFDEDDCRLLRALADQASIAIENARLYKDLEKQIEILEELNKIGTHIINLDFEKVFRGITKGLHEIIKVDIPMIYLLNDDKDKFNIVYGDIRKDWESECHP
jgi:GAF domain-containing protein